jgi:NADPH-dependent 2,4-dienoyl-CoA reductase/sulfur reductase-like enzyme/nitrite reductase/ring-hydroxylating ferredoxin subunit
VSKPGQAIWLVRDVAQEVSMGSAQGQPAGPDLTQGIASEELGDGRMLAGHVEDNAVLLARCGNEIFAVDAKCSHYGGPLADGLLVAATVRCPWHHACFNLANGEALNAPAFSPLGCWLVEERDGRLFVHRKKATQPEAKSPPRGATAPDRIVIVGGGAAGFAAAEMLRRLNYQGGISLLSADDAAPVDRPNLSKDYLAGQAPEDWLPLRPDGYYAEQGIDLRLKANVLAIDLGAKAVVLAGGDRVAYDRLLLATGAEPVRLSIPGASLPHVHVLRSLADCKSIIATAAAAERAVVLGASFIGLEVAASLRARGLEVHVVAPETRPMERLLGPQLGEFVRLLHLEHGIVFHLPDVATAITGQHVELRSGTRLEADLVVAGVGVKPRLELAQQAGLSIDRGVLVDGCLETGVPGVFAAGDIARCPDPRSGGSLRVEHWVVAERQGQVAARNMLGQGQKFTAVPFFWSQHYDVAINYVGHAERWDDIELAGDPAARDCLVRYRLGGRTLAVASINRDVASLEAELAMERES